MGCVFGLPAWLCAAKAGSERPNVIVLISDDHRADCLSALGHPQVKTPDILGCLFDLKPGVFRISDNFTVNHRILKDNVTGIVTFNFIGPPLAIGGGRVFCAQSTVRSLEVVTLFRPPHPDRECSRSSS